MSSKADNFKRLAEKRVTECVKKIRLIGNLANKNNYEYTVEQAKQIAATLEQEIQNLKKRFRDEAEEQDFIFKFDD
ncbi:hypothetical protein [Paenibacillus sp. AN1007]|uniref:Histidine kinase n=1 Tax=Paenibacillus sp. AN1007 TaxID=3151385 RepID=A0AAU8N704_9BACL